MSKKRQWNDKYVAFGFTCTSEKDGTQRPQCILCSKIFSNSNLKPSKLLEHFNNVHGGEGASHSMNSLKVKKSRFDTSGTIINLCEPAIQKSLLEASYQVAYLCAKKKKPHTIAEELIKPCALIIAKSVLDSEAYKKIQKIPLSRDTIRLRIRDLSKDILLQIIEDIKASPLKVSIQLDESTDVDNYRQLFVFVRYIKEKEMIEEFLFCKPLELTSKEIDVFNRIKDFFSKYRLSMNVIGSICTDGASEMLGKNSSFFSHIKRELPHVIITHCMLHRHALASKALPESLKQHLNTVINVVKYIRDRALHHRIFHAFRKEIDAEHIVLLYFTEIRWLSKGRMLNRVFELREKIIQLLTSQNCDFVKDFESKDAIVGLAYLADIFSHLNELNISIQRFGKNIIIASENLSSFIGKLEIWIRRIESGNFANFPLLDSIVEEDEKNTIIPDIAIHLKQLSESFNGYFSTGNITKTQRWILDPFLYNLNSMDDSDLKKDDLVEMRENGHIQMEFENLELDQFWCTQLERYPRLAKEALQSLLPFSTTYLCEMGFSSFLYISANAGNQLNVCDDLRVSLSKREPRFTRIITHKQQQPSH